MLHEEPATTTPDSPYPSSVAPPSRRRRWRIAAIVAGLLLLAVAGFIGRILWLGGAFTAGSRSVEEIYLSDGQPLSAASVGARYGNRLLIGQIFGRGILDCTMSGS